MLKAIFTKEIFKFLGVLVTAMAGALGSYYTMRGEAEVSYKVLSERVNELQKSSDQQSKILMLLLESSLEARPATGPAVVPPPPPPPPPGAAPSGYGRGTGGLGTSSAARRPAVAVIQLPPSPEKKLLEDKVQLLRSHKPTLPIPEDFSKAQQWKNSAKQ